jgi:hypothetical protein
MNKIKLVPISILFASIAMAQDLNPELPKDFKPVTVSKVKITCSVDRIVKHSYKGEQAQESITKGKASVSVRTTWASGNTEYRFSDFTSYIDDGKEVLSVGKVMSKIVTEVNGNRITETMQSRQVVQYVNEKVRPEGDSLQSKDNESTAVYVVNGSERTLVSVLENGKMDNTYGRKEIEIKLSDDKKIVHYAETTPYVFEEGDWKIEVLKGEMNCLFEQIK